MALLVWAGLVSIVLGLLYVWHLNRALNLIPPEAQKLIAKSWTTAEIQEAYRKAQTSPTDVKQFLPPKQGRRYVVVGGSGLVGGWIVKHLILRGEKPAAIRILDIAPPQRPEVAQNKIRFIKTDVTDPSSVSAGFNASWDSQLAQLPLTVFHCVAYIKACDRKKDFLDMYMKVNFSGTKHVVDAAKAAGASVLIATSSGSVGMSPVSFFLPPWRRFPKGILQILRNADPTGPAGLDSPTDYYGTCYAYSKAMAEKFVRSADDKKGNFRTGAIRPGHAIYGDGVENSSSVSYDYLSRGGAPTWLSNIVTNFVSAQNVSIAHLAFENTLLKQKASKSSSTSTDVGGRAYCCTDPGPPIRYGNLYNTLTTLAHPATPIHFPIVPTAPMLLVSYFVEMYVLFQVRYAPFLPKVTGDLLYLQPAMFNVCTLHLVYDDDLAKKEIGYKPALHTLEGFCHQMIEWNAKAEKKVKAKVEQGKGGDVNVKHIPNGAVPAVKM